MTKTFSSLDEIAHRFGNRSAQSVPDWSLGTVRRRSITFATGAEDDRTFVVWVQAHAMTGDLRIHPARPALQAADRLEDLDRQDLALLASVEGGTATTSWRDGAMSWHGWIGFQPYDKYPEPGLLRRIGPCMTEFAPSGIYVEDWRYQESRPGPLLGFQLVSETTARGETYRRNGGLVRAGDHAVLALARRQELPAGTKAQDFVATAKDPVAALLQVFDCSVDYIASDGTTFRITQSTDPRRIGRACSVFERLTCGSDPGHVIEHVCGDTHIVSRLWKIDSITPHREFPTATFVSADTLAWLGRESDTLLAPLQDPERRAALCA